MWLYVDRQGEIAKFTGIGKGIVSETINGLKKENRGMDKSLATLRQVEDIDPSAFAQTIRLNEKIKLLSSGMS